MTTYSLTKGCLVFVAVAAIRIALYGLMVGTVVS